MTLLARMLSASEGVLEGTCVSELQFCYDLSSSMRLHIVRSCRVLVIRDSICSSAYSMRSFRTASIGSSNFSLCVAASMNAQARPHAISWNC